MCTPARWWRAGWTGRTGELFERRLTPDRGEVAAWIEGVPGPAVVTYEVGPTGFGLARSWLGGASSAGSRRPSKLQRPSGDRVKTDVRDARHLAQLLHLGEIVAVTVPSVEQQAARDLVSARHRLSKLLLRQGIVYYGGKPWTAHPKVKPGTSEPNHRLGLGVLRSRDGRSQGQAGSRVTL
jgi:transposase